MFKVTRRGIGFKISIGDYRPAIARDLPEVHKALDHYYGVAHINPGFYAPICPFCRQMVQADSSRKATRQASLSRTE